MPADLHWMPGPSRVLVPFVAAWPSHGDQLATVLLAALWGPLAWLSARRVAPELAGVAGVVAATGGAYARFLSTPDSVAVFGVVAGVAWWSAIEDRRWLTVVFAAFAALTRNDGVLLAPFVGWLLSDRRWGAATVAAAAACFGAWHLRNTAIVGDGYAAVRAAAVRGVDSQLTALTVGNGASVDAWTWLSFLVSDGLPALAVMWLVVLPPFWWLARARAVRVAAVFAVVQPLVGLLLAPGVAASGSLFRSAAGVFPLLCVGSVSAVVGLGRWAHAARGYPTWLVPSAVATLFAVFWVGLPVMAVMGARDTSAEVCGALAELPREDAVFVAQPLLVTAWCDRPTVLWTADRSAASLASDAAQYRVRAALVPAGVAAERWPPGWRRGPRMGELERWIAPEVSP
jgi:hypothetical protein